MIPTGKPLHIVNGQSDYERGYAEGGRRERERIDKEIERELNKVFMETASPKYEFGESQWRLFAERMFALQKAFLNIRQALKEGTDGG